VSSRSEEQAHMFDRMWQPYNTLLYCDYFSLSSVVSPIDKIDAVRVFKVRASSLSPRLPLCQISFLSRPPLLS